MILAAFILFGLLYLTAGLVVATAAYLVMEGRPVKGFTNKINTVANIIVAFLVLLVWPIWAGAWLSRFI